jgi:small-conductance mechanosensitive channel
MDTVGRIEAFAKSLDVLDIELFGIGGAQVTVATLATFAVMVLFTFGLAGLTRRAVAKAFARKGQDDEGTAAVASRLARYSILLVGLAVAIHHVGINLNALFAAGAVFAVAIGFAMQNISQNFVSGVILLLERVIKPGDVLEVEGQMVQVKDMGIRATIARTLDEEDIIIPNSQLVSDSVKNFTYKDSLFRLRATVGVGYSADLGVVRAVLQKTAEAMAWRRSQPLPRVLLKDFGDSSVVFEVSVWLEDPWRGQQRRNDLNEAIWWALKEAGITIAFPQVDLHLDDSVVEALRSSHGGPDPKPESSS